MSGNSTENNAVKTGHYVGLKFAEGWLFLHVLETEKIELKPWVLLNENNNRDVIAPDTAGSKSDEFVDEVERQLLEPQSDEQDVVYQLMFGVYPSRMQIYPVFGRDRAPNLVGGAEPGGPQTPLTGYDSPYNNPTRQAEVFTVNDMTDLALQAYNPMDEPKEARLSVFVNKFRYAVIDDMDTMRGFLQGQIPFRDHVVGLGAKPQDQRSVPTWLQDRFESEIHTTEEILTSGNGTSSSGETNSDRFPGVGR